MPPRVNPTLNLIQRVTELVREQRRQNRQLDLAQEAQQSTPVNELKMLSEFQRTAPAPFVGSTNVDEAEKWIKRMEKSFKVVQCSDVDKVRIASFMLEGGADSWWKGERRIHADDPVYKTWTGFRTAF